MSEQGLGATLKQFIRFGIVGGSGVLVNLLVTYVMTQLNGGVSNDNDVVLELPGPYALRYTIVVWVVAFMIANLWNFQLNRRWTFKRDQMRGWWAEFWPFFAIGSLAAAAGDSSAVVVFFRVRAVEVISGSSSGLPAHRRTGR